MAEEFTSKESVMQANGTKPEETLQKRETWLSIN